MYMHMLAHYNSGCAAGIGAGDAVQLNGHTSICTHICRYVGTSSFCRTAPSRCAALIWGSEAVCCSVLQVCRYKLIPTHCT